MRSGAPVRMLDRFAVPQSLPLLHALVRVGDLKHPRASDVIVSPLDGVENVLRFALVGDAARRDEHLPQLRLAKMSERAAMGVVRTRRVSDDLAARLGLVVASGAFETVVVADVVFVLFVELVVRDAAKRLAPEHERLFDRQTDTLQSARAIRPSRSAEAEKVRTLRKSPNC